MEYLRTKTKVIELGKKLVDELGRDPRGDTLSAWMAHYVAEQIAAAQNARGKSKPAAERRCFQTILSLWKHRAALPDGTRPLKDFEPVLRVLAGIDPEAARPFYHRFSPTEQPKKQRKTSSVEFWVDFILNIDNAARILIQTALDEACELAINKRTRAFLQAAVPSSRTDDIASIRIMVERHDEEADPATKLIANRLEKLSAVVAVCEAARKVLKKKLHRHGKRKR